MTVVVNEIEVIRTVIGVSLLIFVAKLFSGIFGRYKIPAVIGEVLAGMFFGPYAIGGLMPFFGEPVVQLNEMTLSFAFIGGIVVLFSAGLEFTFGDVIHAGPPAFLVGVLGVLTPFAMGFFFLSLMGYPWTVTLIISTALTATSIAITVNVLEELQVMHSSEAKIMVNAAIIDDILGMAVLSLATSIIIRGEVLPFSLILVKVLTILLIWFTLLALSSFLIPRVLRMRIASFNYEGTVEAIATILCFGLAFLTAFMGLSPIAGAFVAGVAVAGSRILIKTKEYIRHLNLIFGTMFFALIGAQIDFSAFYRLDYLLFVVLFAIAVASKIIGCGIPGVLYFKNVKKGLRVGYGMVCRGEVALLVAGLGLTSGIIEQNAYVALVAVILATALISPYLTRRGFEKATSV